MSRLTRFVYSIITTLTVSVLLLGAVPLTVSAQSITNDYGLSKVAGYAGLPTGNLSPQKAIAQIINIALSVVGSITLLLIIYAGFLWMTSAGSEEKIAKAKKIMGSAVVGLFIVLASYAISSFIVANLSSATGGSAVICGGVRPPNDPTCETAFDCVNDVWVCAENAGGGGACVNQGSACGASDVENRPCCSTTNVCTDDGSGYFSCQIPALTCLSAGGQCYNHIITQPNCRPGPSAGCTGPTPYCYITLSGTCN